MSGEPVQDNLKISRPSAPVLWTSSFRAAGREPNAVAIARGLPTWFRGRVYDPLRPTRATLALHDPAAFDREYAKLLAQLDAHDVLDELAGAILLCWEPARTDAQGRELCHRATVSRWIRDATGVAVPEWTVADRAQLMLF